MKEYDFYIVPTPIGNLGDITLRAIEVLKKVDLIACEDCRVTQKLLNHYGIKTKCISYHKYNEQERIKQILDILGQGKKMALVSDAGTPLICDPGSVVVKNIRQTGFSVTALAGANAAITFLSQVPRSDEKFQFIGFMPKNKNQTEEIINKYKAENLVFYESPNRISETLKIIQNCRPDVQIAVGRELTKLFEEVETGSVCEFVEKYKQNSPVGEFVVMVYAQKIDFEEERISDSVKLLQNKGFSAKDISVILSELYGINKNKIYKIAIGK